MTLNDLERQNSGFYGFFGDFGLRHKSISFKWWRHGTIVMWPSMIHLGLQRRIKPNPKILWHLTVAVETPVNLELENILLFVRFSLFKLRQPMIGQWHATERRTNKHSCKTTTHTRRH